MFAEHADDFGQSRAWCLRAAIDWLQGQAARADDAWARAAVHARRADEQWQLFWILAWRASAAVYGPTPVRDATERCVAIREQVHTSAVAVAVTLHPLAVLHAMLAEFDSARSLIRQGNQILEEVGGTVMQSAPAHHEARWRCSPAVPRSPRSDYASATTSSRRWVRTRCTQPPPPCSRRPSTCRGA